MQTFLPYPHLENSAKVLDRQRLGKQRVEGFQILKILLEKYKVKNTKTVPWQNHPAVLMWIGHHGFLTKYIGAICEEWIGRGYKDSILEKTLDIVLKNEEYFVTSVDPYWFGDPDFHASHRSNLLRKNPKWYMQFNWTEPTDLEYWWPSKQFDYFNELLKINGWK